MQGRGWGYFARSDKYCAGHILFWAYNFDNVVQKTNIYFNNISKFHYKKVQRIIYI